MKRILITGAQGYIGSALAQYLRRWPEEYSVDFLSLREEAWRQVDFGGYDAIVHAAAIVHQPKSKDDPSQAELYDRVNHLLTAELAQKAKNEGVSQFLFLSSESVYGLHAPVGKTLTITADTPLNPSDNYGISKLKAEEDLSLLRGDGFRRIAGVRGDKSGIELEVWTTLPGVQLYTGNRLHTSANTKAGQPYGAHGGLCLETQFFPDSPHHPAWGGWLEPGQKYDETTEYRFS